MDNFDPKRLSARAGGGQPSRARSERLFLVVDSYETPPEKGFHYAVGHRADNPESVVRVRLTTVPERCADRPNDKRGKIESQYVTGENHRDTIAEKAKNEVPYLSFDDARRIGEENGVVEYRAHWPKTMSTDPGAEVMWGIAHVRLRDGQDDGENKRAAQAYIELFKSRTLATGHNIDEALAVALSIKDEANRARDPLVILRVMYQGKQYAAPRLYPETEVGQRFDQAMGDYKEIRKKLDADATVAALMAGGAGRNEYDIRQKDQLRALVAGIKGLDAPRIDSQDPAMRSSVHNLYLGALQGKLQVEVVAAEKIDFGGDSRKTYLADKHRAQLAVYEIQEPKGEGVVSTPGYTETVLAVHRYPDGEPYAVFASPAEMYPRMLKLADVPMGSAPEMELASNPSPSRPDEVPAGQPSAGPEAEAEEELAPATAP